MLADIQKGFHAADAAARSDTLDTLVRVLEQRGGELDEAGLDLFAEALSRLLRLLPHESVQQTLNRLAKVSGRFAGLAHAPSQATHDESGTATSVAGEASGDAPDAAPVSPPPDAGTQDEPVAELSADLSPIHREMLALAHMPTLDAMQTNQIVSRGNDAARLAVAQNPGANFARSSLTTLAELAISDLSLKHALVQRHDLPEAIGDRLWPFLSDSARAHLLTARRSETLGDFHTLAQDEQGEDGETPQAIAARVQHGEATLGTILKTLTADGRLMAAALVLADICSIAPIVAAHAVLSPAERPLAVLLKAVDADAAVLRDIIVLRARFGIGASKDHRHAAAVMQAIPTGEAQCLVQLMAKNLAAMLPENTPPADAQAA
ncbi:MAG: DUF2336 domain-containing protein [Beijerinckiaceae bacterium]